MTSAISSPILEDYHETPAGRGGGGGTLIYSYICKLGNFLDSNFEFQYFCVFFFLEK